MSLIDLKRGNLENVLSNRSIPFQQAQKIGKEICFYDEYYLSKTNLIIKVFRQEFNKDQYLNLPPRRPISSKNPKRGDTFFKWFFFF